MTAPTSAEVRAQLVHALRNDLIGPDPDDARDAACATEVLPAAPSHWYLTGFLAPMRRFLEGDVAAPDEEEDREELETEELSAAIDDPGEGEPEVPVARRPVFPSSMGLTVLVRAETRELTVRVCYGTYVPRKRSMPPPAEGGEEAAPEGDAEAAAGEDFVGRNDWVREPHEHTETLPVAADGGDEPLEKPLEGSEGLVLRLQIRPVPESERGLVEAGTRYATVFLVNQRKPYPRPEEDRGFVFQVRLTVSCAESFFAHPNLRGSRPDDELDERVGDLQYRDVFSYAVGHGVSTKATVRGQGRDVFCSEVSTCWMPEARIEKVDAAKVDRVELAMGALAAMPDGETLRREVGHLVTKYGEWIEEQAASTELFGHPTRTRTAAELLDGARRAKERIARGIEVLAADPVAFEAFRLANQAMHDAQVQRKKLEDAEAVRSGKFVPRWRLFQLAFLLMNVVAQVDPASREREIVDLIFFPTGGGKTEAYLGLAAFTLVLRRLRRPGLLSAGVTVLMRYTLRLLTLDQLERASTLICALELLRRKDEARLGPHRFSIGLWVGRAATPNRFGSDQDHDETTARSKVLAYRKDPQKNPSPIPIDRCPWCGEPFNQDTFELKPNPQVPTSLRVLCTSPRCEFRPRPPHVMGIPVVGVDDEIYRELPCFLIATVDKFAALPWVGRTGLLLGKHVTHHGELGFFGPALVPEGARPLAEPLLPPDLIIQDELHLISGPLGTLVGLYETAIDYLTTREVGSGAEARRIRPKIVASTATVRRATAQIRALFARSEVEIFPPPGPNRRTSFFAEAVPATKVEPRLYVGVAAPGRSMKVQLMRSYTALLAAGQKAFEADPRAADPYMTLVGYFNSLRELGGSRRIVEDEVRARLLRASLRRRKGDAVSRFADRKIAYECEELTSRRTTDQVKEAKQRLGLPFFEKPPKKRSPVDVALASNMISVGVDIQRLGLMVVCGQPKTSAEYIQATSRVGRHDERPGLVVTLLNVHKPRDRSHYEHFAAYHGSFYRAVEATSVTPFSPRAVDRGLAGLLVALGRLGDPRLTPADAAQRILEARGELGFVAEVITRRAEAHREAQDGDDPIDQVQAELRARVESLIASWAAIAADDPAAEGLAYQRYEETARSKRVLLRMPLDPDLQAASRDERRFVANRSMRDVEGTTDVYVVPLRGVGAERVES